MNLDKDDKISIAIILLFVVIGVFVLLVWLLKFLICGNWSIEGCTSHIDIYSKLTAILTALMTLATVGVSAFYAIRTYRKNATLEHAKWLFELYEKFYEKEHLKEIRNKLDCRESNREVEKLVKDESFEFTDYLNFFEFVAFLKKSKQISLEEISDLFGYYLSCIGRHESVRNYLKPNGYDLLNDLLNEVSGKK